MTTKVYEAIAGVMADLAKTGISKDSTNSQQNFKFRGIDAVYNALATKLAAHKLCILPRVLSRTVTEKQTRSGGALFYTVLDVEFDFVSAEDGSKHTVRTIGEAMDSGDKSTNKAMSAAYKYACIQAFCIPTEGDNDADGTTHEVMTKAQQANQAYETIVNGILSANTATDFEEWKAHATDFAATASEEHKIGLRFAITQANKKFKPTPTKEAA